MEYFKEYLGKEVNSSIAQLKEYYPDITADQLGKKLQDMEEIKGSSKTLHAFNVYIMMLKADDNFNILDKENNNYLSTDATQKGNAENIKWGFAVAQIAEKAMTDITGLIEKNRQPEDRNKDPFKGQRAVANALSNTAKLKDLLDDWIADDRFDNKMVIDPYVKPIEKSDPGKPIAEIQEAKK